MNRRWNAAMVALTLVRLGQELGTASPATKAIHDCIELLAALASYCTR